VEPTRHDNDAHWLDGGLCRRGLDGHNPGEGSPYSPATRRAISPGGMRWGKTRGTSSVALTSTTADAVAPDTKRRRPIRLTLS
jgi:hypothetical protein